MNLAQQYQQSQLVTQQQPKWTTKKSYPQCKEAAMNVSETSATQVKKAAPKHNPTSNEMTCPQLGADSITQIASFVDRTTLNAMLLTSKAVKKSINHSDLVQWPWPQTLPKHLDDRSRAFIESALLSPDGNRAVFRSSEGYYHSMLITILDKRFGKLSFRKSQNEHEHMHDEETEVFVVGGLPFFSPDGRLLVASSHNRIRFYLLPEIGQMCSFLILGVFMLKLTISLSLTARLSLR